MKILIIGGSGLIGRHLSDLLSQQGHDIVISSRKPETAMARAGNKHQYIEWDCKDPAQIRPHLEGIDAVINLAGENIGALKWWTKSRKRLLRDSRVVPGQALAKAILGTERRPATFIQASAIGYYGIHANGPMGESRKKGEGFLAGITEEWEASIAAIEENGIRVVYVRTGLVLTRASALLSRLLLPFKFGMGVIPGSGNQWLSWIHLEDEVNAIRFLLENPKVQGVFNLTAPEPVTMRQLVKTIGKIRRLPAWVIIPGPIIRLIFGQMGKETILASQDIIPESLLDAGYAFHFIHLEDALADLIKRRK